MKIQSYNNTHIDASIERELRFTLDIMPLKAIIYMLSFARQHAKGMKSKRYSTVLYSRKMLAELRFHKGVIKISKKDGSLSGELLCKSVSGAIYACAGFFYTMSKAELSEYVSMFEGKRSINLLSLPAECALSGKPFDEAIGSISYYVSAVPMLASRSIINTILHIMQFEKSIAISSVSSHLADKIVGLSLLLDNAAKSMKKSADANNGIEKVKKEIADILAQLSYADPYIKDIIMEMLGTESANTAKLFRIVRKKA